jgi:hypothetical protein
MLDKMLRLARECLPPEGTGPRRTTNCIHRQNLREKATRKQHYIMKQQQAAEHERKMAVKQERKNDVAYRRQVAHACKRRE